jgi:fimbrial chaperone protein
MTGKFNCHPTPVLIYFGKSMKRNLNRIAFFIVLCLIGGIVPSIARSQEWGVAPVKLYFSGGITSGVITISNDSANKLSYQMKAFEWTQDNDGKDVYNETSDLVFYPKVMSVEPKDQKIIRVGTKIPRGESEKTYRLFIEDITRPPGSTGASVVFAVRFGVPIFFGPSKENIKGILEPLSMERGILAVPVRNTGNTHFVIQKVIVQGFGQKNEAVFSKELAGWYILAGMLKKYTVEIPRESCQKTTRLDIETKSEQFTLKESLNVQKSMCLR